MLTRALRPMLLTLLSLIVLEIFSTAILPIFTPESFSIPFSILVILYLSFKLELLYLPLFIVIVQFTHGFFSVEGWEVGTIAGILICLLISVLKDLMNLTSSVMIILMVQLFQFIWFLISSVLYYLHLHNFDYVIERFWSFIPESIVLSLISPFLFSFFDLIWKRSHRDGLSEGL